MYLYFTHHRLTSKTSHVNSPLSQSHTPSNQNNRKQGRIENERNRNNQIDKSVRTNLLNRFDSGIDSLRIRYDNLKEKNVCRSKNLNKRFTWMKDEKENDFEISKIHERNI